jgi:peroxiredoxin
MKLPIIVAAALLAVPAFADTPPETGSPAPAFTAQAIDGTTVDLSKLKGKVVVLEWTNKDCPFVHKMYDSGAMQALQARATGQGVEWITIMSSAPGKQGYVDAAGAARVVADRGAHPSEVVLDPTGRIGHLYAAKTTPDMFVIDKDGTLVYEGAIDDKPSADKGDIAGAHNYVQAALDSVEAGKPVETPVTVSYGCSVKY